jgi:hypothetical protein
MKSDAVFLRLLGVRRFRTGGMSSSSLLLLPEDGDDNGVDGEVGGWLRRRVAEDFFLLGWVGF